MQLFNLDTIDDTQRDAILERRAEQLAEVPKRHTETLDALTTMLIVFALGSENYAFPSTQVQEVRPLAELTVLPGTPTFVAGLLNVRGRIVPVLDLRPLFGLPMDAEVRSVLLLLSPRGEVGIVATDRPVVSTYTADEMGIRELPAGAAPGLQADFVQGITNDLIVVLDAERLVLDQRLIVQEGA